MKLITASAISAKSERKATIPAIDPKDDILVEGDRVFDTQRQLKGMITSFGRTGFVQVKYDKFPTPQTVRLSALVREVINHAR